ncbi:MAG: DNA-3-methyladenine glycosylase [Candidatus Kapabacteria bacterium]|nr:DNA-3-methyladenine glycosylase [Candidatus Kapabacteria bacterium]MDW8012275.1 DNA-3-methyladenine glycosylase [Bacteroidota bacterium]
MEESAVTDSKRRMSLSEAFEPNPALAFPCEFFQRPTVEVARALLGAVLVKREEHDWCAARLVEIEAYLPEGDPANHAARGWSRRTAPMFQPGGILYVYAIYGRHRCVNIVTEPAGRGAAVLLRAAEPIAGIALLRRRRGDVSKEILCRGPANLALAFGFDLCDNFRSVCSDTLFIQPPAEPPSPEEIAVSPRVGVTRGRDLLLRFFLRTSAAVSKR